MTNFSKDELLAKNSDEIRSIANDLGIETTGKEDHEDLVYLILDEQAIANASTKPATKRRTRIVTKKKTVEKVVSATKNNTIKQKSSKKTATTLKDVKKAEAERQSLFCQREKLKADTESTSATTPLKKPILRLEAVEPRRKSRNIASAITRKTKNKVTQEFEPIR